MQLLSSHMIKLKNTHVGLTAIDAGMSRQVSIEPSLIFFNNMVITRLCPVEIDLLVILIVDLVRFGLTVLTPWLTYTTILVPPTKILLGIALFATVRADFLHRKLSPLAYSFSSTSPKSPPFTSLKSLSTVTVGTAHLAFGDFGLYSRPRSCIFNERCYITGLITTHMIKLKTSDISFTAIDTRMRG